MTTDATSGSAGASSSGTDTASATQTGTATDTGAPAGKATASKEEKPAGTGHPTGADETGEEEGGRKTHEPEEGKGKETKDKPTESATETGFGEVRNKLPVETGVKNERRALPATITAAPTPFPRR